MSLFRTYAKYIILLEGVKVVENTGGSVTQGPHLMFLFIGGHEYVDRFASENVPLGAGSFS